MTAVRCSFLATCSMLHVKHAGGGSAAGTVCARVSVAVRGKESSHWHAGWSTCSFSRRQRHLGLYGGSKGRRRRSRVLVLVCAFSAREVANVQWMESSGGVNIVECAGLSAGGGLGACSLAQPFPALPWLDHRVKQARIFPAMLLWSVLPDSTCMVVLGFACTLVMAALPRYWWQNDRCGKPSLKKDDGVDNDAGKCLCLSVQPELEISEMASLVGVFTFNFDSLLVKLGLLAFCCVLLTGLFNVGYSMVGVANGQSVRRRVIRAQRHGDFRDRLRKRLGERESGFRVTYQQPLPGSYFAGRGGASVPEELFDEAHGVRSSMTRYESAQLRRPKDPRDSNRSTSVGHDTASLSAPSGNVSIPDSQVTKQGEISHSHVSRPSPDPSVVNQERRSIAKPGSLPARRTVSEGGVSNSSKVPSGEIENKRASARTGSLRKWHEKDELELKARVEELRRKVLAAEQTRQAAMRSLAEEKRRSLELEVKISRQKESSMALEEEVRVLKESHEALLTSLRKKYSSSVAARAAAALLYQNWDSSDDNSLREMVH